MNRKVMTHLVLVSLLLVTMVVLGPTPAAAKKAGEVAFWLTVLHNNDGESELLDLGGDLDDFGGAARFKTVVDNEKWGATHGPRAGGQKGAKRGTIMVSSGDNFLAGPEFTASMEKGVPFYDTIAMDLIGYTAVDSSTNQWL